MISELAIRDWGIPMDRDFRLLGFGIGGWQFGVVGRLGGGEEAERGSELKWLE